MDLGQSVRLWTRPNHAAIWSYDHEYKQEKQVQTQQVQQVEASTFPAVAAKSRHND